MRTKLKLVKTVGGSSGSPLNCHNCHSKHFSRTGVYWQCIDCKMHSVPFLEGYKLVGNVWKPENKEDKK